MDHEEKFYQPLGGLGYRSAKERVAYLLCDVAARMRGVAQGHEIDLPLATISMSNAVGLTPLHVRYAMKKLELRGFLSMLGKRITIPDLVALCRFANFEG